MPLPITRGALSARGFGLFSAPATVLDPYFPYVTMLLHGDGTNGAQNNTFLDSSTNNFSITRNGNTTQGSFSPYGSNWSNYFGGVSGNYLAPQSATSSVAFGTGNFTFECWLNADSTSGNNFVLDARSSSSQNNLCFLIQSGSWLWQYAGTNIISTASGMITVGTWNHVAFVRNSGTLSLYVNGSLITSVSDSTNYAAAAAAGRPGIAGGGFNTTEIFKGYISNLRIVVGTAVYTSAFTPSTTPLTAISGTSLLTCQSNRFIDNSANNFAITVNGTPSVQRFSPFSPTAAYSTSVIGGSGYFDGSGDYLTVANNAAIDVGTGAFTYECWYYPTASKAAQIIAANGTGSGGHVAVYTNYVALGRNNIAEDLTTSAGTIIINQWNHIVVVRNSSNNTAIFINGVRQAYAASNTNNYGLGGYALGIGIGENNTLYTAQGYITDARVAKSSLYGPTSTSFTVPTAPLSASSAGLLASFTNGAIFDNAMMNDLETVGNAQISTSVFKFGTGSLAFDGTGDWLTAPNSKGLYIGSGDFTIEGWLYLNALGSTKGIVSQFNSGGSGPGWTLYTKTTNVLEFYGGSGTVTVTGTTAISATTWTHFAVVRSGSTITIYINGTAGGTATNSSFSDDTTALVYVGGRADNSALSLNGYIDDLRITKGYARYTSNFSVPTAAFPNQ